MPNGFEPGLFVQDGLPALAGLPVDCVSWLSAWAVLPCVSGMVFGLSLVPAPVVACYSGHELLLLTECQGLNILFECPGSVAPQCGCCASKMSDQYFAILCFKKGKPQIFT